MRLDYLAASSFEQIIVEGTPLIDVRAPIEFNDGAFPTSINLPLMNDEERKEVGICYKQKGSEAAIELGYRLVSGSLKQERVDAWVEQIEKEPNTLLYCFRGGMRSQIAQQWIFEATGKKVPRLEGGYKAFRRYLISRLDPKTLVSTPVVLGGKTGAGKTILLRRLSNRIDLEAIANHRGSSFGRFITPQPTPINFENRLAWAFVCHAAEKHDFMVLEDEGRNVGDRYLPKALVEHFAQADLVLLERPLVDRVQITFEEYVLFAQQEYRDFYGEDEGLFLWFDYMQRCLFRIRKRLGGKEYQDIKIKFEQAHRSDDLEFHKEWIKQLLVNYYDPMYEYQIQKKRDKIVFRGDENEVFFYLENLVKK